MHSFKDTLSLVYDKVHTMKQRRYKNTLFPCFCKQLCILDDDEEKRTEASKPISSETTKDLGEEERCVSSRCLSSRNTVTLPSYCGSFESEENEAEAGEVEAPEAEDEEDEANKGYNEILNVLERLENETEGEVHGKDSSESRLLNLKSPYLNKKSSFCDF